MATFILCKSQEIFDNKLNEGSIPNTSIVFIEDEDGNKIWTHGKFFGVGNISIDVLNETKEEIYDKLTPIFEDIYRVIGMRSHIGEEGEVIVGDDLKLEVLDEFISWLENKADKDNVYTKTETNSLLDNKVDKVDGKQLSTEDFTTSLKQKLEGLTNYNDTELNEKINELKTALDTILDSDNTTAVIDTWQEIEAFLNGITNTQTLTGLLNDLKSEITKLCADKYVSLNKTETIKGIKSFENDLIVNHPSDDRYTLIRGGTIRYYIPSNTGFAGGFMYYNEDEVIGSMGLWYDKNTPDDTDGLKYYYIGGAYNKPLMKVEPDGNVTATGYKTLNGNSSQFLKADGSVDSKRYMYHIRSAEINIDEVESYPCIYELNKSLGTLPYNGAATGWMHLVDWGTSDNSYHVQLATGYTSDLPLYLRHKLGGNWKDWKIILDSANFSNYALPLTGGTVSGTLRVDAITSANKNGLLSYRPTTWDGVSNSQWGVGTLDLQGVIRSNNSNLMHYRNGVGSSTIWDSNNDGAGSGLDADTLDGVELNAIHKSGWTFLTISQSTDYYWHRIAKITGGEGVQSSAVLELLAVDDMNYASLYSGKLALSAYITTMTMTFFTEVSLKISVDVKLTRDGYVWVRYRGLWASYGKYRIISQYRTNVEVYTSNIERTLEEPEGICTFNNRGAVKYIGSTGNITYPQIEINATSADKLTTTQLTNEDLNNLKTAGTSYYAGVNNTVTNKPLGIVGFGLLVIRIYTGPNVLQLLTTNAGNIYKRYWNSVVWSDWKRMLDEDDIAPLLIRIEALESKLN